MSISYILRPGLELLPCAPWRKLLIPFVFFRSPFPLSPFLGDVDGPLFVSCTRCVHVGFWLVARTFHVRHVSMFVLVRLYSLRSKWGVS